MSASKSQNYSDIAAKLSRHDVYGITDALVTAVKLWTAGLNEKQLGSFFQEAREAADPCLRGVLGMEYNDRQSYPTTIFIRKPFVEGLFGLVREDDGRDAPRNYAHINCSLENLHFYWLEWGKWFIVRRLCARHRLAIVPPNPRAWALGVVEAPRVKIVELCSFYDRREDAQSWISDFCAMVCALSERLADENTLARAEPVGEPQVRNKGELMDRLCNSATLSHEETQALLHIGKTKLYSLIRKRALKTTSRGRITSASVKEFLDRPTNKPQKTS